MTTHAERVAEGRAATHDAVVVDRRDDRAIVTLHEPERLNALTAALCVQLDARLAELTADPAIRTIVLTGADPGFSAGGDLRMMEDVVGSLHDDDAGTTEVWRWIRYQFGGVVRRIARSDTAFVAAINGPAAGVGLAFALSCDLAIASDRARIVPAFGRLGLLPEVGTSWALTRRLGYQGAFAFFAAGEHMDAAAAQRAGLVHEVVPHDELLAAADRWCDRIAQAPPHAIAMAKPLLRAAADATWDQALTMEEYAEPNCFTTRAFADSVGELLRSGPGSPPASPRTPPR
jgi:2-(1,2-epoxy-1,2-dihydrophenyl)acetyl-CoA isomerase